ncbi:Oxygen-dependent choline dehydrogenase [Orchesella cincta]|uniref:Oxygen-dependent choline dehydrogenase n=1 Tax=Orchesella cincta TaxID=48709 RepID=A0A1D2NED5_ORCCI|nr:Oxygen-dependent choline dehydrogenase [Orchesella cincta]
MVFPLMPLEAAFAGIKALTTPLIQPLFVPVLYYTFYALGTILAFWTKGDRIQDEADSMNPQPAMTYDFIIVGAGSAGSLLANRLSRNYNVLLLEAGGEPNPLQFIPGFGLFLINYPEIDWQHLTVPQRFASLNSISQRSSWSTGLGLGGTGNLNLMIHLRGHRRDFDNWANITGDPSWSWEGVLPYFKSYEDYEIPGDNVNHGYGGDLRIEAPDYIGTARDFVAAGGELGYPNVDLNAPFTEGFDVIRYPIRRGIRQSPYKAFLDPARTRASLRILKFAHVNKVLFRNGNNAYGVEFDRHGRTYVAEARREVIVSAGAGEFVKFLTLGRGRLTSTGCEAVGIISSEIAKARGEGDWPDLTIFQFGLTNFRIGAERIAKAFSLKFDEINKYLGNDIGRDSLFMAVQGSRPLSRGYIRLGGSSPYDRQIIEPNYLGDPEQVDLRVLLDGIQKTLFLMENTTASQRIGATFTTTRLPGCEHLQFRSPQYWECFARRYSVTLHHPVGTASMGTVVDTQLRVIGTENLRVVDASIQPVVVTTNTQASTLMIAEKAADMILRFWNNKNRVVPTQRPPLFGKWGGGTHTREVQANIYFTTSVSISTDVFPYSPSIPPTFSSLHPHLPHHRPITPFRHLSHQHHNNRNSRHPTHTPSPRLKSTPSPVPPVQLEPMPTPEKLQQLSYYKRPPPPHVKEPDNSYYDYDYDSYDDTRSAPRDKKANFTGSNNIDDQDYYSFKNNF